MDTAKYLKLLAVSQREREAKIDEFLNDKSDNSKLKPIALLDKDFESAELRYGFLWKENQDVGAGSVIEGLVSDRIVKKLGLVLRWNILRKQEVMQKDIRVKALRHSFS